MSPSTKVFATLALSAAVGKKMMASEAAKDKIEAGKKLFDAGYTSTGLYPYPALGLKKVNEVGQAVEALLAEAMEPQEIISMLLAGLSDICAYCKPARVEIINPVLAELQNCLDLYDEPDHDRAFERYQKWVAA